MKKKLDEKIESIICTLGDNVQKELIELDLMDMDEKYYQLVGRIFARSLINNIDWVLQDRWEIDEIIKGMKLQFDIDSKW
jgi:chaperonin cofactor prefoldin